MFIRKKEKKGSQLSGSCVQPVLDQVQKEINWLNDRIDHIASAFPKSKSLRIRIKSLKEVFQQADIKVNNKYRQDGDWQRLLKVDVTSVKSEKKLHALWEKVDIAEARKELKEADGHHLDGLIAMRNRYILSKMAKAIIEELLEVEKVASKSEDGASYKNALQYTLNEIYKNRPNLLTDFKDAIQPASNEFAHFCVFPALPVPFKTAYNRADPVGMRLFGQHRTLNDSQKTGVCESDKELDRDVNEAVSDEETHSYTYG